MYQKNLIPLNTAHSSLSKALFLDWAKFSSLEKNPSGSQALSFSSYSTLKYDQGHVFTYWYEHHAHLRYKTHLGPR
jgi:hypothetical protein